jgi:hypothetical protein
MTFQFIKWIRKMKRLLIVLMLIAAPCFGQGTAWNGLTITYDDTTALTISNQAMLFANRYSPYVFNGVSGSLYGFTWSYSSTSGMFWLYDAGANDSLFFRHNGDTVLTFDNSGADFESRAVEGITNLTINGAFTGRLVKTAINFSITRTDTLIGDALKIWTNFTGATVTIDSIWIKTAKQNLDLTFFKRDKDTYAAGTLVDSLVAATAITSGYKDLETTISSATLTHDQELYITESDSTNSKAEGVVYIQYTEAQ